MIYPYTWVCGIIRLFFVLSSRPHPDTDGHEWRISYRQASPPDMIDRRGLETGCSSISGHRLLERDYSSLLARLALCQEKHALKSGGAYQTNSTWAIDGSGRAAHISLRK